MTGRSDNPAVAARRELVDAILGGADALPAECGVCVHLVRITPQVAERLLRLANVENRKPRRYQIEAYAADMMEGDWRLTGEPILLSDEGRLLSGQHRLLACVSSGVPFPTVVVTGVPSGGALKVDTGLSRTSGDQLGFLGVANRNRLAAAARVVLAWDASPSLSALSAASADVRKSRVVAFSLEHEKELVEAIDLASHAATGTPGILPRAMDAFFFRAAQLDQAAARLFSAEMADPYGAPVTIQTLHKWGTGNLSGRKATVLMAIVALVRAWNYRFTDGAADLKLIKPNASSIPAMARPDIAAMHQEAKP